MLELADGSALHFRAGASGSFVSPPGEYSTLASVSNGRFKRVTPDTRVTVWYSSAGLVDSITDNNPTRNKGRYVWTGTRLDSVVDPVGKAVAFSYDGNGRLSGIAIPSVASIGIHQNPRAGFATLDSIADPDGFKIRFGYESSGLRMTSSKARGTDAFSYVYDVTSRVDSVKPPAGTMRIRRYDSWQSAGAAGPSTTESAPANSVRPFDAKVALTTRVSDSVWYHVDRFGAPMRMHRPLSPRTAIERDSVGQAVRVYSTNAAGDLLSEYVDEGSENRPPPHSGPEGVDGGVDVRQQWDAKGNLIRSIAVRRGGWTQRGSWFHDTTTYSYHPVWQTVTRIDPPNHRDTVRFTYDAYGRRDSIIDARGAVTAFAYGARGLVDSIKDASAVTPGQTDATPTVYRYLASTLNLDSVKAGPGSAVYGYDVAQVELRSVTDASGMLTTYTYDAMKRPLEVRQHGAGMSTTTDPVTTYAYNDATRQKTLTDPLGLVTTWQFDAVGRATSTCYGSACETVEYGDSTNPTSLTDRKGTWTQQKFDVLGRLSDRIVWSPTFPSGVEDSIAFRYDQSGNLVTVDNRYSRIARQFDAYGRIIREKQLVRGFDDTLTFHGVEAWHEHDALGRRVRTYMDGTTSDNVTVTACASGAACDVTLVSKDTLRFSYDAAGALTTIGNTYWKPRRPFSGRFEWIVSRDAKGRSTGITFPTTSSAALGESWELDDWDQITVYRGGQTDSVVRNSATGRVEHRYRGFYQESYSYDGLGRLSDIYNSNTASENSYTYDKAGNRLTDKTYSYEYGPRGRLWRKVARNSGSGITPWCYRYDSTGSQLAALESSSGSGGSCAGTAMQDMQYDGQRRMRLAYTFHGAVGGETRHYYYDGLGRKVVMRSDSTEAPDHGLWRYFWLDDQVASKSYNFPDSALRDGNWPQLSRNASDSLVATGEWLFYGEGIDNVLGSFNAKFTPGKRHLFWRDHRGSVVAVTNTDMTAPLERTASSYEAFGKPTGTPTAGDPGFNGQESSGGLVYMRNRWYDPNTGRFTQEDPIGHAGGINLYAYAGSDPISYKDPFGLCYLPPFVCPPPPISAAGTASSAAVGAAAPAPPTAAIDVLDGIADGISRIGEIQAEWTQTVVAVSSAAATQAVQSLRHWASTALIAGAASAFVHAIPIPPRPECGPGGPRVEQDHPHSQPHEAPGVDGVDSTVFKDRDGGQKKDNDC